MAITISNRDLNHEDKEEWKYQIRIRNYILNLNETDFWNLINKRLEFPTSANEIVRVRDASDIEYWTMAHLTDELFLQLAKIKEILNYNGKKVTIYKYYNQALRMWKWIPISKPKAKFIINISDLTSRIYCELKSLENHTSQYVLKESVKRIFENIDFKFYHEHIANNLEVVLEDYLLYFSIASNRSDNIISLSDKFVITSSFILSFSFLWPKAIFN